MIRNRFNLICPTKSYLLIALEATNTHHGNRETNTNRRSGDRAVASKDIVVERRRIRWRISISPSKNIMGCGRGVTRKVASSIPSEGKYTAISRISGRVFGSRCKHLVSEPRSSSRFIPRGSREPGLPFVATRANGERAFVGERREKETEGQGRICRMGWNKGRKAKKAERYTACEGLLLS